ncbi:MAG: monovalent cation/H+ antiporter subunit D family protein [Firmicutes bacterium]|nr:monovalent cation/H+ antiporter subunit D family protein [Bacillota bacterium]
MENAPALVVVFLLLGAFLIPIVEMKCRRFVPWLVVAPALLSSSLALIMRAKVRSEGPIRYYVGGWAPPWGIEMLVDEYTTTMLTAIFLVGVPVLLYSVASIPHELSPDLAPRYHALNLLLLGSLCGMAMAGDIFNLYVFMEISSLAACGTISAKGTRDSVEASLRYFLLSELGSGCILLGIAILHMLTGHLNMGLCLESMPRAASLAPSNVAAAAGLVSIGLLVKGALFPLHIWLPDAHAVAPAPSSAILSGLVVKVAAFALWRVLNRAFGPEMTAGFRIFDIILLMATLGIILGSALALNQTHLKRMLAFSTVGQVAYIFLGLGFGSETAVHGAFLHLMNHAVAKACLFLSAGAISQRLGVSSIQKMAGIGRLMPITMACYSLAAFSMVGIPPLGGFTSKWYLAKGALEAGRPIYVLVILVGSFLALLYTFPPLASSFFATSTGSRPAGSGDSGETPAAMLIPIAILGAACVVLGIDPGIAARLTR